MPNSLQHFVFKTFMMAVDNPLLCVAGLLLIAWQVTTNPERRFHED